MQNPEYIYSQPQRFISYFVNPAPPIGDIESHTDGLSLNCPFLIKNSHWLLSISEPPWKRYLDMWEGARPSKMGTDSDFDILGTKQAPLLAETDLEPNPKPELIENMVRSLENLQLKADQQSQLLKQKEQEIYQLKAELEFCSSHRTMWMHWLIKMVST